MLAEGLRNIYLTGGIISFKMNVTSLSRMIKNKKKGKGALLAEKS
jgi:hypothetical protein